MVRNREYKFFNSDLTKNTIFCGNFDMPYVKSSFDIPEDIITFERALKTKNIDDYNKWVVFYMEDYEFEKIWNNPKRYIPILRKFKGVVTPDFSMCLDMPYSVKIMNNYRSKVIGSILNQNNIKTIPNVRWCDDESLKYCIDGIEKNTNIFIGTLGCIKNKKDCKILTEGLDYICKELRPNMIFFYGSITIEIKSICEKYKIPFKIFKPQISQIFGGKNGA